MTAIVPFISLFFLLLISRTFSSSWRESVLTAAVIWGLLLTVITETLSAFHMLSYPWILASWLMSGTIVLVLYLQFVRGNGAASGAVPSLTGLPLSLLLPIGFIVSLTGLIAFIAAPNNYDSMTYHLSRVVHWVQNHSVQHYPTSIERQLFMPPWAGFAITHFYVLSGGDRLANGVQWFSMLGSVTGVSLIAKQLGGSKESQLLAALLAACLPMGILQATSTQTDYVVTLWLVCFAHFVLRLLEVAERPSPMWIQAILAGLSLGLAILTKPTAYFVAAPFMVWLFLSLARRGGVRLVKYVLVISAIAIVINGPHYLRTADVFGSPLAPLQSVTPRLMEMSAVTNGELNSLLFRFASNLMRNTASELAFPSELAAPFYYANRIVEVVVGVIEAGGIEAFVFRNGYSKEFKLSVQQNNEDFAGNPIHLILIGLCGAVLIAKTGRERVSVTYHFFLALFAAYLTFVLFLGWDSAITRLHLPLSVLGTSVIAVTMSGSFLVRAQTWIVVLVVVASQFALLHNRARPLLGAKSILAVPRMEQYFRTRPDLFSQFSRAAFLLKDKPCSQIGFLSPDGSAWEYPLWVLLGSRSVSNLRIEHILVANQSAKVSVPGAMSKFSPCGLVAVEMTQVPDLIMDGGREYSQAWTGKTVAVYEVR